MSPRPEDSRDVFARLERHAAAHLRELIDYLRIPSISTDPAYAGEVARCAGFIAGKLRSAGLDTRTIETARHPLVYGEWLGAADRPTLLFYGHYDVQPPEPLEAWRHPPFEPVVEDGRLVARGATDDKGQSFAHLKAVEAVLAERGSLPVNVKFLLEGEEESGGESIERFVSEDGGKLLACDGVVISDGEMFAPGRPSLLYGLRGILAAEIRVSGPARDLHSGTYGGAVTNPANALAAILARLHDPRSGRVAIPGFYDEVRPLAEAERRQLARLPFDDARWARDLGVSATVGEIGYTALERSWARPSCDVNGLWGGYQGRGVKTVLPATAGAKLSLRLVPDQEPATIFARLETWIAEMAPAGVRVEVESQGGTRPVLVDLSGALIEAVSAALEEVWGRPPLRMRDGGSLPVVSLFTEVLRVPVALAGFGLPDDGPHAPNEKLDLESFYGGIRTVVRLMDRLGAAAGC